MKEYLDLVMQRAEELEIIVDKKLNHLMDLTYANKAFDIDWKAWYESDNVNFAHDFLGIYQNIDRVAIGKTHKATADNFNLFVPRFAR